MIDEGYRRSSAPIKLTKESIKPDIPRDEFKVKVRKNFEGIYDISNDCMRHITYDGKSYAVTYWNCPFETTVYPDGIMIVWYNCAECKLVTWIEVDT